MSVIVYDGHMLACDMQVTAGSIRTFASKLHKLTLRDGDEDKDFFIGVIGCMVYSAEVLDWFRDNLLLDAHLRAPYPITRAMEENLGHTAVVAYKDANGMNVLDQYTISKYPERLFWAQSKMAWGTGRELALGALTVKGNAVTAVKVCLMHDRNCGFGYEAYVVGTGQYFRHQFDTDWASDIPKDQPTEPVVVEA